MNCSSHFLQEWRNGQFVKASLYTIGLIVQLGHPLGDSCTYPKAGHANFIVAHTNGLHEVALNYCQCRGSPTPREQLLDYGWWPATVDSPQTCATIQLLRQFHHLSLQCSTNLADYFKVLELMSDPWTLAPVRVSCVYS